MKVLFIYYKYHPYPPHLSNMHSNLTGSFLSVYENDPNYECEHVYIGDEDGDIKNSEDLQRVLLEKEYDLAIVSEFKDIFVKLETAKIIKKKIFIIIWDSHCSDTTNLYVNFKLFIKKPYDIGYVKRDHSLIEFAKYSNVYVLDYGYGEMHPNIYCDINPQDSRDFYIDNSQIKDIDVLFNGSVYTSERKTFIDKIKRSGIDIKVLGGKDENGQFLSFREYANNYRRAKISLTFQHSGVSIQQKGRELESAACGAFVLATNPEAWKAHTGTWFEEDKHLVRMSLHDCVDKINYYLHNNEERLKIAKSLNEQYEKLCSPRVWWERTFARINDKD